MPDHEVGVTIDGRPVTCTHMSASYGIDDSVRFHLEVTVPARTLMEAEPPPPRDDVVTHLGARCCCRHCPEGGDHA